MELSGVVIAPAVSLQAWPSRLGLAVSHSLHKVWEINSGSEGQLEHKTVWMTLCSVAPWTEDWKPAVIFCRSTTHFLVFFFGTVEQEIARLIFIGLATPLWVEHWTSTRFRCFNLASIWATAWSAAFGRFYSFAGDFTLLLFLTQKVCETSMSVANSWESASRRIS